MQWLAVSLVLSLVLTVALNLALRAFPHAGEQFGRWLADLATPRDDDPTDDRGVRVIVPWKAMLIASVVLTVALNLFIRIF